MIGLPSRSNLSTCFLVAVAMLVPFLAGCQAGTAVSGDGHVVEVGRYRTQLFLHDNHVIDKSEGLQLVMGKVEKHPANPLMTVDRPWELGNMGYGCILHDVEEGLYKMWYESRENFGIPGPGEKGRCLYAVSKDGVKWEKPELNVIEHDGSRKNNMVFIAPEGAPKTKVYWVVKDYSDPDPDKLYKMMFHLWDFGGRGIGIGYSPDGIHWTATKHVKLHGGFDTQNLFLWDDRIGRFVGYLRGFHHGRRSVARSTSPDAYHWSEPVIVHAPDAEDPPEFDLYTPAVFKYSRADDVYVMVTAVFDHPSNTLFGQLALSRDGIRWYRFREPFLALGAAGEWDRGSIYPIPSEAHIDGKSAIYYRGNNDGHGAGGAPGMGVALLHEGGFAGWRADNRGTLTTHPLRVHRARSSLYLNADATEGSIRADLLSEAGDVIPGFSRADCQEVTGSGGALRLQWKGQSSLESHLRKGRVRLKLYLSKATVYGLRAGRS